tara:strand:- start:2369 stop:3439 length:1071 start_codon:yes stop_codon:yes gene_type:complete
MKNEKLIFNGALLTWHQFVNKRLMPWKGVKDPYKVWLSEIILQQTRVEQGMKYYHAFLRNFPTIKDLADASEDEVLRLWQGLGYYSRARNLHFTAKDIVKNYEGQFPQSFIELLKLKGVGRYTAAAIASFVYKEPVAVLDGNVIRVLSRYLGIDTPFDTGKGRKVFENKANELLDKENPDKFNQAIMDFGATVCKPKKPSCEVCPLALNCVAYNEYRVSSLPVRKNRVQSRSRYFFAFHIENEKGLAIEQRTNKDIWQGLYQLPLQEVKSYETNLSTQIERALWLTFQENDINYLTHSPVFKQQLSHQKIHIIFVKVAPTCPFNDGLNYTYTRNLTKFAFPKIFILYLQGKSLLLD